jgi:hypothetical protein
MKLERAITVSTPPLGYHSQVYPGSKPTVAFAKDTPSQAKKSANKKLVKSPYADAAIAVP